MNSLGVTEVPPVRAFPVVTHPVLPPAAAQLRTPEPSFVNTEEAPPCAVGRIRG